jgi:hypothetical protein
MDAEKERALNVSTGAAVLAGAASFVISWIALSLAAISEGLIPLFEAHPAERLWLRLATVSVGVLVASAMAWLVFRLLRDEIDSDP